MKKWQYKVALLKSLTGDPSDHNIDVSVEEGKSRMESARGGMENALNKLGEQGWELVGSFREFALLKKPR